MIDVLIDIVWSLVFGGFAALGSWEATLRPGPTIGKVAVIGICSLAWLLCTGFVIWLRSDA